MIASRRWQDWTVTLIGGMVALSPFVFAKTWTGSEAVIAYVIGGLVFLVGVVILVFGEAIYLEWVQFALAAALAFAPWLIGFTAVTGMAWTAWLGAVALVLVLATHLFEDRPATAATS